MIKIKLKTLRIPVTDGKLIQASSSSPSGDYQTPAQGTDIEELYFYDRTGVIAGERLGTEHICLIPFSKLAKRPIRGDKVLINRYSYSDIKIDSILWQSGNTVRLKLAANYDRILQGDYVKISGATNAVNNGIFLITAVNWTNSTIDITNISVSDATKNETTTPAVVNNFFLEYEILDLKDEMLSYFEDHYNLALKHRND
jgi:hypothetical protein